ncbi:hypothetical protein ONZ51_g12160 [Trametes cubensis]|uniref:Uncharacterized protein n=1 Tax=Trametes cubensis TaxID=1111947 RepID=A0AAD7TJ04_9APHY|nr:hypothetical protein ONZ51_g12160 [Trametes cubensis]
MPAAAAKTAETTAFEIPKELEFGKENNRDPAICRKGSGVDAQNAAPGMYRELFYNSLNMSTAAIRKAATIRFLQGMEFGSGKLVKKSLDAFTLDVFDGGNTMGKEGFLVFPQTVTLREKKLASPGIRSEFVDHALFGPRHMFWPPPDALGGGIPPGIVGMDRGRQVRPGEPGGSVGGRRVGRVGDQVGETRGRVSNGEVEEGLDIDLDVDVDGKEREFSFLHACAFCSVSPVWATPHDHVQCPYIGTLNKVRSHLGILPIKVEDDKLVLPRQKVPVNVEEQLKELFTKVADLDKRLAAVEKKPDPKGKKREHPDDSPAKAQPAKKVKQEKGEKEKKGGKKADKGKGEGSSKGAKKK